MAEDRKLDRESFSARLFQYDLVHLDRSSMRERERQLSANFIFWSPSPLNENKCSFYFEDNVMNVKQVYI